MNKGELISKISEKGNLSKRNADTFVNLITDYMITSMGRDERIEIRGFGAFTIRRYEPYEGRNPKTGEKIKIESKRLPFFKAGKDLLSRINS